jgi:hypothetical protein
MRIAEKPLFERVITVDDVEQFSTPTNTMKQISQADAVLKHIGEGESVIDTDSNKILIKKDGKYFKQVLDGTDIKLEEV